MQEKIKEEERAYKKTTQSQFPFGFVSGVAITLIIVFGLFVSGVFKKDARFVKEKEDVYRASDSIPKEIEKDKNDEIVIEDVSNDDWVRGDADAPITIVEFSDTECPFCQRFHVTMQRIVEEYDGKVRWAYRHFPLENLHSKAVKEAEATECAGELGGQEGFWTYLDRLMEVTPSNNGLDPAQLPVIAGDVDLNVVAFNECLEEGRHEQKVREHIAQASAAGGRGTPYSIILYGDEKLPIGGALPFEQVKAMIDPLLQ